MANTRIDTFIPHDSVFSEGETIAIDSFKIFAPEAFQITYIFNLIKILTDHISDVIRKEYKN